MTAATVAVCRAQARTLRRQMLRLPEAGTVMVVVAAWAAVALGGPLIDAEMHRHADIHGPPVMTHNGTTNAVGLDAGHGHAASSSLLSYLAVGWVWWTVMVVAMMGPAALGGVRHTRLNSLRRRRARAVAEYGLGYLTPWCLGPGALVLFIGLVAVRPSLGATAACLGTASLWQLTAWKQRALQACHRSIPLPATGWRAEAAAARFGARNGSACLGSCWPLMTVMFATPAAHAWWTLGLTVVVTSERLAPRPRRTTRVAAVALAAAAALVGVLAALDLA